MRIPGWLAVAQRRPLWAIPALLLAAGAVWWAVGPSSEPASTGAERAESAAATARKAPDPMSFVTVRSDVQNSANVNELIAAYGAWASRSDALEARRAIVRLLLGHSNLQAGLEALLTAVELDQTPKDKDPLWRDLVKSVAPLWDAVTFKYGRDLVHIEARPKPKDLVLESLAEIRPEKLAEDQKPLLASDFIDIYPTLKPDQKPAVDKALEVLAGQDVVDILAGRGLAEGDKRLQLVQERERVLDQVKRARVREAPAVE